MSGQVKKCCVPGCTDKQAKRHRIPANKVINEIWLQRINNPKLTADGTLLTSYRICDIHFEKDCKDPNGKLMKLSLPTLYLPSYQKGVDDMFWVQEQQASFSTPKKLKESIAALSSSATTFTGVSPIKDVKKPIVVYPGKRLLQAFGEETREEPCNSLSKLLDEPSTSANVDLIEEIPSTCGQIARHKTATALTGSSQSMKIGGGRLSRRHSFNVSNVKILRRKLSQWKSAAKKAQKYRPKRLIKYLARNQENTKWLKNVNMATLNFFMQQQRNQKLKPRGRRFTLDDKIFSLSCYKNSGKGYRFLSKIFSLPSRRTLTRLLNRLPFNCGINEHIFNHLKGVVEKMDRLDRFCTLVFDEMSLDTGLTYNPVKDCLEGLVDFGRGDRRAAFADHALLFMVKGVRRSWKQPIGYYFCEHSTKTPDLVRIIKEVVRALRNTGLRIVASVCDLGSTNASAINTLLNDTNAYCIKNNINNKFQGYLIDGEEIVHLFDYPHLFKCLRNGLLQKDLKYFQAGVWKIASWDHILKLYNSDKEMGIFRSFPKLTDQHILKDKIKKMRVKNCTQVFSRTVATTMKSRAEISLELQPESRFYLNPKATETADLILFLDMLFDSLNGSLLNPPLGKELRGVVTATSKHVDTWHNALPILNSFQFIDPSKKSGRCITPSIKKLPFTIKGFVYIWQKLKHEGFKYLSPRNLNQDAIENFFGMVRSHGIRNTNPSCSAFVSSTKSLIVNNFMSSHSPGFNCEADFSTGALDTFKSFLTETPNEEISPIVNIPTYKAINKRSQYTGIDIVTPYVAGAVAKKLFKTLKCLQCKNMILSNELIQANSLIYAREYKKNVLCAPSKKFSDIFRKVSNNIFERLPSLINSFGIKKQIIHPEDLTDIS